MPRPSFTPLQEEFFADSPRLPFLGSFVSLTLLESRHAAGALQACLEGTLDPGFRGFARVQLPLLAFLSFFAADFSPSSLPAPEKKKRLLLFHLRTFLRDRIERRKQPTRESREASG